MYTLTSTSTKLAALALSAAVSAVSLGSVVLSFQTPEATVSVIELPTVVIIGYRASLNLDTMQAAAKTSAKAAI